MVFLFCLIILFFGFLLEKNGAGKTIKRKWYIFEWFCLVAVAGLRYKTGGDSLAYQLGFDSGVYPTFTQLSQFEFLTAEYQPLWYLLVSFLKSIWDSFTLLQIVHALFVNTIVFWFVRRYAKQPFLAILFYYVMVYPYFNMEILRESISVCFFLLSYPYLIKKNYVVYGLFSLLAFGFHASALCLFFVPLLMRLNQSNFSLRNMLILLVVVLILAYTPFIQSVIALVNMASISSRAEAYGSLVSNLNGMILPFIRLFFVYLILCGRKIAKINNKEEEPLMNSYLIILGIATSLHYFYRVENYFLIPFYVFLLNTLPEIKEKVYSYNKSARYLVLVGIAFLLIHKGYYYTRDMSSYNGGSPAYFYHLYFPYESVFDPVSDRRRENVFWNSMQFN